MFTIYIKNFWRKNDQGINEIVTNEEVLYTIPIPYGNRNALADPQVKMEIGKAGSFEFSVYPTHPYYSCWIQMRTIMRVEYDGDTIFRGRVLTIDNGLQGTKKVHLEGDMAFLLDTVIWGEKDENRPEINALTYITNVVNNHNSKMIGYPDKQFKVGEVPGNYSQAIDESQKLKPDNSYKYGKNGWQESEKALEELAGSYGGYFRTRYVPNDGVYIDWLTSSFTISQEPVQIKMGVNLVDLNTTNEVENIFTVVIPKGSKENNDVYLDGYTPPGSNKTWGREIKVPDLLEFYTVNQLNEGFHSYEEYANAIAKYGIIYKTVEFKNADTQAKLWQYSLDWIKNNYIGGTTSFTATAIDLHLIGQDVPKILAGDMVNVIYQSYDNMIDGVAQETSKILAAQSVTLDLYHPEKNQYTIGIPNDLLNKQYGTAVKSKKGSGSSGGASGVPKGDGDDTDDKVKHLYDLAFKYVVDNMENSERFRALQAKDRKAAANMLKVSTLFVENFLNDDFQGQPYEPFNGLIFRNGQAIIRNSQEVEYDTPGPMVPLGEKGNIIDELTLGALTEKDKNGNTVLREGVSFKQLTKAVFGTEEKYVPKMLLNLSTQDRFKMDMYKLGFDPGTATVIDKARLEGMLEEAYTKGLIPYDMPVEEYTPEQLAQYIGVLDGVKSLGVDFSKGEVAASTLNLGKNANGNKYSMKFDAADGKSLLVVGLQSEESDPNVVAGVKVDGNNSKIDISKLDTSQTGVTRSVPFMEMNGSVRKVVVKTPKKSDPLNDFFNNFVIDAEGEDSQAVKMARAMLGDKLSDPQENINAILDSAGNVKLGQNLTDPTKIMESVDISTITSTDSSGGGLLSGQLKLLSGKMSESLSNPSAILDGETSSLGLGENETKIFAKMIGKSGEEDANGITDGGKIILKGIKDYATNAIGGFVAGIFKKDKNDDTTSGGKVILSKSYSSGGTSTAKQTVKADGTNNEVVVSTDLTPTDLTAANPTAKVSATETTSKVETGVKTGNQDLKPTVAVVSTKNTTTNKTSGKVTTSVVSDGTKKDTVGVGGEEPVIEAGDNINASGTDNKTKFRVVAKENQTEMDIGGKDLKTNSPKPVVKFGEVKDTTTNKTSGTATISVVDENTGTKNDTFTYKSSNPTLQIGDNVSATDSTNNTRFRIDANSTKTKVSVGAGLGRSTDTGEIIAFESDISGPDKKTGKVTVSIVQNNTKSDTMTYDSNTNVMQVGDNVTATDSTNNTRFRVDANSTKTKVSVGAGLGRGTNSAETLAFESDNSTPGKNTGKVTVSVVQNNTKSDTLSYSSDDNALKVGENVTATDSTNSTSIVVDARNKNMQFGDNVTATDSTNNTRFRIDANSTKTKVSFGEGLGRGTNSAETMAFETDNSTPGKKAAKITVSTNQNGVKKDNFVFRSSNKTLQIGDDVASDIINVEMSTQNGGSVKAGKQANSNEWLVTINEPISYTTEDPNTHEIKTHTLPAGSIKASDFNMPTVPSFKTEFAAINTIISKAITTDVLTVNQIATINEVVAKAITTDNITVSEIADIKSVVAKAITTDRLNITDSGTALQMTLGQLDAAQVFANNVDSNSYNWGGNSLSMRNLVVDNATIATVMAYGSGDITFNVADTQTYRDGVSAAILATRTQVNGIETTQTPSQVSSITYSDGKIIADFWSSPYYDDGTEKVYYHTVTQHIEVDGTAAYEAGLADGGGNASLTISDVSTNFPYPPSDYETIPMSASFNVNMYDENNNLLKTEQKSITFSARSVWSGGWTAAFNAIDHVGATNITTPSSYSTSDYNTIPYNVSMTVQLMDSSNGIFVTKPLSITVSAKPVWETAWALGEATGVTNGRNSINGVYIQQGDYPSNFSTDSYNLASNVTVTTFVRNSAGEAVTYNSFQSTALLNAYVAYKTGWNACIDACTKQENVIVNSVRYNSNPTRLYYRVSQGDGEYSYSVAHSNYNNGDLIWRHGGTSTTLYEIPNKLE